MIEIDKEGSLLFTTASGTLEDEDYDQLLSTLRKMMDEYDKINWYLELKDFEGWSTHAFWRDISFSLTHRMQFDKIAVVCENKWQEAMIEVMELFSAVHVEYFDESRSKKAKAWLQQ